MQFIFHHLIWFKHLPGGSERLKHGFLMPHGANQSQNCAHPQSNNKNYKA
ncbi:MAG: hypothetical protein K0S26_2861 [Bacteroidota bacterium]|jgi:hypothetical protein|nr:hypothetical protein [Bacteroidota bacterium]